jgi:hypothetical protein
MNFSMIFPILKEDAVSSVDGYLLVMAAVGDKNRFIIGHLLVIEGGIYTWKAPK